MAKDCCDSGCNSNQLLTPRYRKILWIALIIDFAMFLVEVLSGFNAHSVSLMADAIGNVAVIFAAFGVFGSGSAWPDLVVAVIMASLGISAAIHVIKKAHAEMT